MSIRVGARSVCQSVRAGGRSVCQSVRVIGRSVCLIDSVNAKLSMESIT